MKFKSAGPAHVSRRSFEMQLNGYSTLSTAVLATSVAAGLASPATSLAQITNITVTPSLTLSGVSDGPLAQSFQAGPLKLELYGQRGNFSGPPAGFFSVKPDNANAAVAASAGGDELLAKFANGASIKAAPHFHATTGEAFYGVSHAGQVGNFIPAGSHTPAVGYVGFREKTHGKTYYGWLRVKVTSDAGGVPATISLLAEDGVTGAWNEFSGGAIDAGEVSAIPEPANVASGLGLLALGAAGVREMRRRRKVAA